jgi:hypothetical protein
VTTFVVPICYSCARLHPLSADRMTCDAFPTGIPDPILESEADHRQPYTGDNGIRFAQDPARPEPDLTAFEGEP